MELNDLQKNIIETISSKQSNVLIQGVAGSGKTYLLNELSKVENLKIMFTATTGIASINLPFGATLHSFLALGLEGEKRISSLKLDELRDLDILVIDEMSMLDGDYFQNVSRYLLPNVKRVLCGDLLQLPPVKGYEQ